MHAEVVAIGDELTSGQRLDTNSQWISQRLGEIGIFASYHSTVADDYEAMKNVLLVAVGRADVILASGGLGPTADDLTRSVIADVAGVQLQFDEASLRHIRGLFASRNREMPGSNEQQAYFPAGSQVIPNPHGTAPGIDIEIEREGRSSRIFALPGVPAELKTMWQDYVAPRLQSASVDQKVIRHHAIHCFGAGESHIESRLPDLVRRQRKPQVGITASQATITLRITAVADHEEECISMIESTATLIRNELGDLVFGHSEMTLQDIVIDLLSQLELTIAVVDFDLVGLVANWLAGADPQSKAFRGGWLLTDQRDMLDAAAAAKDFFGVDLILAIGHLARTEASSGRSVAIVGLGDPVLQTFDGDCHPELLLDRSAKQALNFLRLELLKLMNSR